MLGDVAFVFAGVIVAKSGAKGPMAMERGGTGWRGSVEVGIAVAHDFEALAISLRQVSKSELPW